MVENGGVRIAAEVEIRVVGHVDDRGLICGSLVGDVDLVVLCEGVGSLSNYVSREVVVASRLMISVLAEMMVG